MSKVLYLYDNYLRMTVPHSQHVISAPGSTGFSLPLNTRGFPRSHFLWFSLPIQIPLVLEGPASASPCSQILLFTSAHFHGHVQ